MEARQRRYSDLLGPFEEGEGRGGGARMVRLLTAAVKIATVTGAH